MARSNWNRDELIVAFNLYCKMPFGKIHNRNPDIIGIAKALGRTPSALSWKLANFARFDPLLKKRDIVGAAHGAKLEELVWEEFNEDWERLAFESESLLLRLTEPPVPPIKEVDSFPDGRTRDATVRLRVNQGFFRAAVLAAYDCKCCITGLAVSELLCASHIIPWNVDVKNRTNPSNGLCLNAIHDRAFDRGLLTISLDHQVVVSPKLRKSADAAVGLLMNSYQGKSIQVPGRFAPSHVFLKYHHDHIFQS